MEPTADEVTQFQQIWRDAVQEEISQERARHELALLVELYEVLGDAGSSSNAISPATADETA